MDKYFYFVSQLPALVFDRDPGLTKDEFMEEAAKWLSAGDLKRLSAVTLFDSESDSKGPRLVREFREFEARFRTELAKWRKARHDGQDMKTFEFPAAMVKEGNPLEVEKKLLHWRWQQIDAMEGEHHFDLEWLILYYLKLQILQRISLYNKEKGLEIFRDLVSVDPLSNEAEPAEIN